MSEAEKIGSVQLANHLGQLAGDSLLDFIEEKKSVIRNLGLVVVIAASPGFVFVSGKRNTTIEVSCGFISFNLDEVRIDTGEDPGDGGVPWSLTLSGASIDPHPFLSVDKVGDPYLRGGVVEWPSQSPLEETAALIDFEKVVALAKAVYRNDRSTPYRHHQPREWDGRRPSQVEETSTIWLTPREMAGRFLRRHKVAVPDRAKEQ